MSAVPLAAQIRQLALEYHKTVEGEYGCPGHSCPGVQRLVTFAEACAAAALDAAQAQPWQPIATAPKDADVLLLYQDGHGVQPGYWYDLDKSDQVWVAVETQGLTGGRMQPTHWRPLPEPPAP